MVKMLLTDWQNLQVQRLLLYVLDEKGNNAHLAVNTGSVPGDRTWCAHTGTTERGRRNECRHAGY